MDERIANKSPYTREELDAMVPIVDRAISEHDAAYPDMKPLPPMTKDEAMDYFGRLMNIAHERPLTTGECFIHGQLTSVFAMAIRAEMLGLPKDEAFIVLSKSEIDEMTNR